MAYYDEQDDPTPDRLTVDISVNGVGWEEVADFYVGNPVKPSWKDDVSLIPMLNGSMTELEYAQSYLDLYMTDEKAENVRFKTYYRGDYSIEDFWLSDGFLKEYHALQTEQERKDLVTQELKEHFKEELG